MKTHVKRSTLLAATSLLASGVCHNVLAQSAVSESVHDLEEVTITARTPAQSSLWVPAQQLSGAALTQRQGSTLGETLDNLPGIANGSFGPNVGRPIVRGMEGDRTRMLQNGGALMDVSGLSNDHALPIDPLTTERIEVLRGPAALLYGGSAIGGVVNVIDNRIARERSFEPQGGVMGKAELRAGGAANERSSGALVEAGNDRYVMHVDAFERSTRDLRVPQRMTCDGTPNGRRVCNSASDTRGAAVGGTLLFDSGYLGLSTSEYRNSYGTVAEPTVRIGMTRRHNVMEGLVRGVGRLQDLQWRWGHTQYSHTEYDQAVAGTRFDNRGNDLRLQARQQPWQFSNGWQLQGVSGWQRESNALQATGEERFLPASHTRSAGVFTYQAVQTAWGQLSAAVRAETTHVRALEGIGPNNENAAQAKQFKPLNWSLGALRHWRQGDGQDGWQLSTHLSGSQRAPKDYELFAYGPHVATAAYEIGQPTNGIEKGTQLDVGGEWKKGPHQFSVTGFVAEFSNYLSLQPTGEYRDAQGALTQQATDLPTYRYEGVRARFHGVESVAKLRMVGGASAWLTPQATHGIWDWAWRADAVRATDLTHQQPMPRLAPLRWGSDVLWSYQAWNARLGFMHAAAQNRMPPGSVTTAGYTLWNAGLSYHTHQGATHWLWFAKLDNITNALAYPSTSVLTQTLRDNAPPLPGRSLKVGAQVSF